MSIIFHTKNSLNSLLRLSERYIKTDMLALVKSNIWLTLTRVVGTSTGVLLTIASANYLTPDQFGTYKYILAGAGIVAAFGLSGLNTAVTRAIAQHKDDIVRPIFAIGFLASIPASLCALAIGIYYLLHGNMILGIGFTLVALTNPFFSTLGITKSILLGKEDYRTFFIFQGLGAAIPALLLLAIVLYTKNVLSLIVGYFIINVISGLIIYIAALRKYHIPKKWGDFKETFSFGSHLSVMGFVSQIGAQIDQLLLWHFTGPAAVAHYALALAPMRELRIVLENVFYIIFPRFARYDAATASSRVPLRTLQFFIVCAVLAFLYIVSAPYLFAVLFPQYVWAVDISRAMALGLLLLPRGIAETYLTAHGALRARYVTSVTAVLVRIGLFIVLIPSYNIIGAVAAILISDAVAAIIIWYYYFKSRRVMLL